MDPVSLGLLVALGLLAAGALALIAVRGRRARSLPAPPDDLSERLDGLIVLRRSLSEAQRERHAEQVLRFLQDKRFIGCAGLAVDDDMRVAIAGLACLLVLRAGAPVFPAVRSVLVYPGAFLVPVDEPDELGLVDDEPEERIGESWHGDRVIVAWDEVEAALAGDACNVVVHEFAHQLDDETPHIDGAPQLADYERWAAVMQREFERLRRHRRPPVLDPYGAESPEEFFGVVSEAFVQRGAALRHHHAELYGVLADYYGFAPEADADYFSTNARSMT